jgi:nucleoside-triphosphatase THEP1
MDISELCGNKDQYNEIISWVSSQIDDYSGKITISNLLFVCGNSGIGKSYSVQKICSSFDLDIINITINTCISSSELSDNIIKASSSSLVQQLTCQNKKKIILIDEFESMMAIDRTINTTLLNILSQSKIKKIPIICISSNENIKKLGTLKKKCKIIELTLPTHNEVFRVIKKLLPECNEVKIHNVIKESDCNLSHCFHKLQDSNFESDNIDEIMNIENLYGYQHDIDYIIRVLHYDIWLNPLRFHENLITELSKRKTTIKKRNEYYLLFIKNIIVFDILMNHNLHDNGCCFFAYLISPLRKLSLKPNVKSDISKFTKILSYLSLQNKYTKKSYSTSFPLYQISNYHVNTKRNYMFFN